MVNASIDCQSLVNQKVCRGSVSALWDSTDSANINKIIHTACYKPTENLKIITAFKNIIISYKIKL